ncbi:two-component system regulatory protein YycI [Bacillaceae bacterium S4-13-58]
MQWGQIKTLFIICFLILDIFLLLQFMEKRNQTELEIIAETTFQDQLAADEIMVSNIPAEYEKEAYISSKRYKYTAEDRERMKAELSNQEISIVNEDLVLSTFRKPIKLIEDFTPEDLIQIVRDNVLYGNEYEYWDYNQEKKAILFFQQYKGRTINYNQSGLLLLLVNDNGEIVQYSQTLMHEFKEQSEEQELVKPINAIETLYDRSQLSSGDEITSVQLGYYTFVPLSNGVQVFAPTWIITVNQEKRFFVNAVEGIYISTDEGTFVDNSMTNIIKEIEATTGGE